MEEPVFLGLHPSVLQKMLRIHAGGGNTKRGHLGVLSGILERGREEEWKMVAQPGMERGVLKTFGRVRTCLEAAMCHLVNGILYTGWHGTLI